MGLESQMLEYGLLQREASDYGATVNYAGVVYPCSLGTIGFGARLVAGGFSPHAETTVVIRKSILPANTVFATGQTFAVTDGNGDLRNLKIASEGIRDLIYAFELTCDDPSQNA